MPPGFAFPPPISFEGPASTDPVELWTPLRLDYASGQRGARYPTVLGRLRAGKSLEQAEAEIQSVAGALAMSYPESNEGWDAPSSSYCAVHAAGTGGAGRLGLS